ncbi:DUF4198 domain-containing protein [Dethiosulfatarculus sandiegensis]|uniref:Nickel transporter n=1 Tax=Dethiosulfatarculus sandiegensis TaxID=1429043 RepID=A0A0D2HKF2_9BACT|nr:DUF4198 domain-containing protein [Dethiosulfatarculus sandiegensis]KIX11113.1 nickel transporter [Dethiosulfatarculus sandiegensis]
MKKFLASLVLGAAVMLMASPASAHSLWVNLFESFSHHPGHMMTSLGWGHSLPMDDFLAAPNGSISIKAYDLIGPDSKKTPLGLPVIKKPVLKDLAVGMKMQTGDLGLRKLALTPKTKPGTYQVAAQSKPTFFSMYLNKKGRTAWAPKPMNEIKNAQKVLRGMRYESFAKSLCAVKKWTDPKPVGHALELMPLRDVSNLRKGQLLKVKCTLFGKPVATMPFNMVFLTAASKGFNGKDGFTLASTLNAKGEATFRLPTAGQWLLNIYLPQDVDSNPKLKDLKGKCTTVMYASSLTINVNP